MKHLLPHLPVRNLAILGCLFALCCGLVRAQETLVQRLDVYFGETKLLAIDRPVDSFTVTPENIIKVDKSDVTPGQLSIVGLAGGSAMLTVKSDGRTFVYDVAVSSAPERIYINLNESKRLTFPDPIDDTSLSQAGIVRVVQPDTANNVLLVEASTEGKTTLTVTCKSQLYRYFISTFENRGADLLEIQNDFSAKGYRNLTIAFDKDQAVISGTVPTQEELDDAVRIVKQFTQYVVVKATLGQEIEQSEYSLQESIIINNIQRIANVKGLTIRVKYAMPTVITTSTLTKSIGDYIEPSVTTTPQGGTVRGSGFQPPANPAASQGPNTTGPTELKPQQNTTETTTSTENTSIPEKIFLYGDLQDDLDEAKVIRVARTFCPFIVNFLTVRDPIQIRTEIRFMQVKTTDTKDTGFTWTGGGVNGGPSIALGFSSPLNAFSFQNSEPKSFLTGILNHLSYGITGTANATATLELIQSLGFGKIVRSTQLFLTNGQPGWYSEGEVQSYISSSTVALSTPPVTTLTASSVFLGVNMDISPLNLAAAGGTEPTGQKIYGIPGSVGGGSSGYNLQQDSDATPDKVGKVGTIQAGGGTPVVDNTVKYVDENGLIGMNISTQLTLPNGSINGQKAFFNGTDGAFVSLPNFFVRTTRTRVSLRDGQTIAINGLIDKETSKNITQVPFFASLPLFGNLFKSHADSNQDEEVIVLVTPHLVRMRDGESGRYPRPRSPELMDAARASGDVPIIKPVRYDAGAVDIRPETPKDMKDVKDAKDANEPPPLAPHATGGMQTLQPPADASPMATPAVPAVDNKPQAPDNSQQPSGAAPLAPSSTLP